MICWISSMTVTISRSVDSLGLLTSRLTRWIVRDPFLTAATSSSSRKITWFVCSMMALHREKELLVITDPYNYSYLYIKLGRSPGLCAQWWHCSEKQLLGVVQKCQHYQEHTSGERVVRGRPEVSTLSYTEYHFLWPPPSVPPSLPKDYFKNVDSETPSQNRNAP